MLSGCHEEKGKVAVTFCFFLFLFLWRKRTHGSRPVLEERWSPDLYFLP